MAKGNFWLPKGTVVKWNDIEIVLDGETNDVVIDDSDWPTIQRALFPEDQWDESNDDDPTPYCSYGHKTKAQCDCGPIASNE